MTKVKAKPKSTPAAESGIRDRVKELRRVRAGDIVPSEKNWRTHPENQRAAMRGVLDEIGYADALLARELPDGTLALIDGHLRRETTPDEIVPVLDVTEAEADKLLLTLDPLAAMAGVDAAALDGLLREVETGSEALAKMLADLANQSGCEWAKPEVIVEDEVPEPPAVPVTKPGDLWLMGEHRLLCGDSTKTEDVARLMNGMKASGCVADPPYDLDTAQGNKGCFETSYKKVTSKALQDISDSFDIEKCLDAIGLACDPVQAFVFCSNKQIPFLMIAGVERGLLTTLVVWNKYNSVPFSHGTWRQDAEWCVHFKTKGATFNGDSELKRKVKTLPINPSKHGHPTEKPVALITDYLRIMTSAGERVFDPFLGSGTTLIAAEQLNRRCYGLEISPAYVDVCVTRWETLTGKKATLAA